MKFSLRDKKFIEVDQNNHHLAVSGTDEDLSWNELKIRSEQIETYFVSCGVREGDLIALYGHKEANYIAAICACLKLNCPYIPLDPIYPEDRIKQILKLSQAPFYFHIPNNKLQKISPQHDQGNSEDLIYIIFTSGSTGLPKGVKITRENISTFICWAEKSFPLFPASIYMNQALFTFDLAVFEIMLTLTRGETLVLNDYEVTKDQHKFLMRIANAKCTTWISTPSFAWTYILSREFKSETLPQLKLFIFCGEVLPHKLCELIREKFPNSKIMNSYGPTEATVACAALEITDTILARYNPLPIGNKQTNGAFTIAPSGELVVSGDNVMKGYLNTSSNKTFQTGDLVFEKDDFWFYTGRLDQQIKYHGNRIELEEINTTLENFDQIIKAVTIALSHEQKTQRLICFVKLNSSNTITDEQLRSWLSKKLPTYMIPSEFLPITNFPLTSNKKIDIKTLLQQYKDNDYQKL